jgi:hypothetical protein
MVRVLLDMGARGGRYAGDRAEGRLRPMRAAHAHARM